MVDHEAILPNLVRGLPNLEQTDGRMKPIEYGQRHRDMSNDCPGPLAEEGQMRRPKHGPALNQRVYQPHCHVGNQEERYYFSSGLESVLAGAAAAPPPRVQYEQRLDGRLRE